MKHLLIILLICVTGFSLAYNHAYGLWIRQSPDELLNQSQTIFVGNITSIRILEFPKSSVYYTEENGIEKQIIENYTLALDEYTVNVEQFLKNPQDTLTMTVRQPTTSVPGMIVPIDGFEMGDRVLFYVEKIDGENTYSPESFKIPIFCDASSVLSKPRFSFGSDMKMMQNGIRMDDNFTAGIPIQFVYGKDVRTLEGKGYDIDVGINKIIDSKATPIFREKIRADAKPCEWIALAEWTITPQTGKHSMAFTVFNDDRSTDGYSGSFFVKDGMMFENDSPLKQIKSGVKWHNVECRDGLELVEKKGYEQSACVTLFTKIELIVRGWAYDDRVQLGCTGDRVSKCYPNDPKEYRNKLYDYYFGKGNLPSSGDYDFTTLHTVNACTDKPLICYGELDNGTRIRVSCDYPIHGCGVESFDSYVENEK